MLFRGLTKKSVNVLEQLFNCSNNWKLIENLNGKVCLMYLIDATT
jgi:hypothetical protein